MESQHMTQQVFAEYLGVGAATLSGIFNDRTKPTINIIEAIKRKFPALNTDWLMFGIEPMYNSQKPQAATEQPAPAVAMPAAHAQEPVLLFDQEQAPTPPVASRPSSYYNGVRNTRADFENDSMKNFDKNPRRVTEIRVFYDDQTWESFVPSKK